MELSVESVTELLDGLGFEITETEHGVRIQDTLYSEVPAIAPIIRAALTLKLDPSQIHDDSYYDEGTDWGGQTGRESDRIHLDVCFLWHPSS